MLALSAMRLRGPLLAGLALLAFIPAGCAPATPTATPQVIPVYASAAAQPWLADLYACAQRVSVVVRLADTPAEADFALQIGRPEDLSTPAFQIDSEEILVVTNRESPVQNLGLDEARALFAGSGANGLEVWVFAPGTDVQRVFEKQVMQGTPITSLARLAVSPQQMSDVLNSDKNAVGILPRHWKAGTVRDVYSLPGVPVLAISPSEPQGVVKDLLGCLQK